MRHTLILFFLLISTLSWGQSGFDVIRKAQRKADQQEYTKALRLLNRAENMNYGFCGNAWIEAEEMITETQAHIYAETGQFELAANTLNKLDWFLATSEADSLKTTYYVQAFSKELVKREIDSCIALISEETFNSVFDIDMSIVLNVNFSDEPFRINLPLGSRPSEAVESDSNAKNLTVIDRFKIALREQPFYQVLL